MAQEDNSTTIIATGNLASAQRTIGGILGQLDAAGVGREAALRILGDVGVPAVAYDDPSFPISLQQDFELLNEVRKKLPVNVSLEVRLFSLMRFMRANMFGALGLAWQSAPTLRDAMRAVFDYPEASWGRCHMTLGTSSTEARMEYHLDKRVLPLTDAEELDATAKYALLLEITAGAGVTLDVASDRTLLVKIQLPFDEPDDWSLVSKRLRFPVEFEAPVAAIVYKPEFLEHIPRRSHDVSFRLAMKLVGKESALLSEDRTFAEQVVRWLWASSPPLKKPEIAKLLGVSERSFTRQLANEGTSYNQLFSEVQSERARNLLGNPKLTVSEVAYRLGYADPAAFTRAFASWTGTTPSKWRLR